MTGEPKQIWNPQATAPNEASFVASAWASNATSAMAPVGFASKIFPLKRRLTSGQSLSRSVHTAQ
jgi:hypothetical protein